MYDLHEDPQVAATWGERGLWWAALVGALQERDREWFVEGGDHVGSFRWVCEELDIDFVKTKRVAMEFLSQDLLITSRAPGSNARSGTTVKKTARGGICAS